MNDRNSNKNIGLVRQGSAQRAPRRDRDHVVPSHCTSLRNLLILNPWCREPRLFIMSDKRRAEIELKRAKLAELRKARADRQKADAERRTSEVCFSPLVSARISWELTEYIGNGACTSTKRPR